MTDYAQNLEALKKAQQTGTEEARREIKRHIRRAYKAGQTVPYELRTILESGVSNKVLHAVYRG